MNADMGHNSEKSTMARVWKTEDLAHSGKEWHSPAFDLLDRQHPAVTGKHHPAAVKGAAAGHSLTSQTQEGTGQLDRLKAEHGKTEGERISQDTGALHGAANTGTKGVPAHMDVHGTGGNSNVFPSQHGSGQHSSTYATNSQTGSTGYHTGATGATGAYPQTGSTGYNTGSTGATGAYPQGTTGVTGQYPQGSTGATSAAQGAYQAGYQAGQNQSGRAL